MRAAAGMLVVGAVALLGACSDDGDTSVAAGDDAGAVLTLHAVERQQPPPCDDDALPLPAAEPTTCLVLGPVVIDATHVVDAQLVDDGGGPGVAVDLDDAGLDLLNDLAAQQFGNGGAIAPGLWPRPRPNPVR